MFDRELDYYGIVSAEGITTQESLAKTIESFSEAKGKHDMFFFALECYYQFGQKRLNDPNLFSSVPVVIGRQHKVYNLRPLNNGEGNLCNGYLERYFGLMVPNPGTPRRDGNYFSVCSKKE